MVVLKEKRQENERSFDFDKVQAMLSGSQFATHRLRNTKLPTEYPAPKEQITPISSFFKSSL
jgi:hypothetical protein